ncbi:MAG: capsule biosynthesis protein CapB [Polyangiaceae bacterium]|nr:capsule biosynthesis protein CapB [Polyangiaceae bacterium]
MSLDALAEDLARRLTPLLPLLDARVRQPALLAVTGRAVMLNHGHVETSSRLLVGLVRAAAEACSALAQHRKQREQIIQTYHGKESPEERRQVITDALPALASSPAQLAADLAATRRNLGIEALMERLQERLSDDVDQVEVAYKAARAVVALISAEAQSLAGHEVEALLALAFKHVCANHHDAISIVALEFTEALLGTLRANDRLLVLTPDRYTAFRKLALEPNLNPWVRVAALGACIVAAPKHGVALLEQVLDDRTGRDAQILRHRAVKRLLEVEPERSRLLALIRQIRSDPSEHVRQGLCWFLARTNDGAPNLGALCLSDPSPSVRGYALRELSRSAAASGQGLDVLLATVLELLKKAATGTDAPIVLRVLLEEITRHATASPRAFPLTPFVKPLEALLAATSVASSLKANVAELLLKLEIYSDAELLDLCREFEAHLEELEEGQSRIVDLPSQASEEQVEKALMVAGRHDLSISARWAGSGSLVIMRGEPRGWRLWRTLFEVRTPAPDKRQGYAHSKARVRFGTIYIAPRGLAEVTPTRVPGERQWYPDLGGWGEFLPRVDDLLFVSGLSARARRIVTAFGTLVISPPVSFYRRLKNYFQLTFHYERWSQLRERSLRAKQPDERLQFSEHVASLGYTVRLSNTESEASGVKCDRRPAHAEHYLSLALPFWFDDLINSGLSSSGNSAWHLAIVIWLAFCGMIVRSAWIRRNIERARRRIPLRIGGWGSRGKSGTERIKAALFHAMRYETVVKTTGCEAMFIHARRDQPAREMFVYRPYDKATIWEQRNVLETASRLKAQVFLWECMALQPVFVRQLMLDWMQDKLATLTNAYPDHEDIMGPSGEDVARVIASFMPENGVAFTAEDQMFPIIADSARRRHTELHTVTDTDAQLLPKDLLDRFPYQEHPKNIALVLALAAHLGVEPDWAMVKMADYVVPDLGVLKTYPEIVVRNRKMKFSNGMSANERAGFLSNWQRLGFDVLDAENQPEIVSVAVVNNRADRVPRSRVFAELLVKDAACDVIVLINSNLIAMRRFLLENVAQVTLGVAFQATGGPAAVAQATSVLDELWQRFRILNKRSVVRRKLELIVLASGLDIALVEKLCEKLDEVSVPEIEGLVRAASPAAPPGSEALDPSVPSSLPSDEDTLRHIVQMVESYQIAVQARQAVLSAVEQGQAGQARRKLDEALLKLLERRICVLMDVRANGDQVIDFIADQVPPGHRAHLLGCQNIKGTGLDFVYRWISMEQVFRTLEGLRSEPDRRADHLQALIEHTDYGYFDARDAHARLLELAHDPGFDGLRAELSVAERHLAGVVAARLAKLKGGSTTTRLSQVLGHIEPWFDHLDSIHRTRFAQRVLRQLCAQQIGQGRAAELLREVTARGKGGWLYAMAKSRLPRLTAKGAPKTRGAPKAKEAPKKSDRG